MTSKNPLHEGTRGDIDREVTDMCQVREWFGSQIGGIGGGGFGGSSRETFEDQIKLLTFDWEPMHLILFDMAIWNMSVVFLTESIVWNSRRSRVQISRL